MSNHFKSVGLFVRRLGVRFPAPADPFCSFSALMDEFDNDEDNLDSDDLDSDDFGSDDFGGDDF